jgi:hypothetical protein
MKLVFIDTVITESTETSPYIQNVVYERIWNRLREIIAFQYKEHIIHFLEEEYDVLSKG